MAKELSEIRIRSKLIPTLPQPPSHQELLLMKAQRHKAASQLHINPQGLGYRPVSKEKVPPKPVELLAYREEQTRKQLLEKKAYANMVRQAYKPKQSEKLARVMKELTKSTETKPRPVATEQKNYLSELRQ